MKGLTELTQSARLGGGGDCWGALLQFHSKALSFSGFEVRQLYAGNAERQGSDTSQVKGLLSVARSRCGNMYLPPFIHPVRFSSPNHTAAAPSLS